MEPKKLAQGASLDIVIPCFNEEDVLPKLFEELDTTFTPAALAAQGLGRVRYVLVDDGSRDRSAEIVRDYIKSGGLAVLYRLSRNFGHQNALSAGLDRADADLIGVIDADLQDPPQALLMMVGRINEGYDVVYGVRQKRKEFFLKRLAYWAFYRLLGYLSQIEIPLDSGDFSLMRRNVLLAMRQLPEKLRFPRGLRAWVGYRQCAFEYERDARHYGTTKYSFARLYALATDGIASSSIRPLKIAQALSFFSLFVTLAFVVYALAKYAHYMGTDPTKLWFVFTYVLIGGSTFLQMLCFYVLSAYIGRMYLEAKGRPSYLIMEVIE